MTKRTLRKLIATHEWLSTIYGIGVALCADSNELNRSLGDQLKGHAHCITLYVDEFAGLVKPDEGCDGISDDGHDSWELVEDDATRSPTAYLQQRELDANVDVDDAIEKMALDLVARCKKLAGVGE